MQLKADQQGFLVGSEPIHATGEERALLRQMRDDVRAIRKMLEKGKAGGSARVGSKNEAANDDVEEAKSSTDAKTKATNSAGARGIATPVIRLGTKSAGTGTVNTAAIKDVSGAPVTPSMRGESSVGSRQNMAPATPKVEPVKVSVSVVEAPKKPVVAAKPARKTNPVESKTGRDSAGRFVAGERIGKAEKDGDESKVLNLLGDIKDGITNVVDLSGGDEVDPAIKAAHELQSIATTAINGVGSVGSAVGKVALPAARGIAGLFKKPDSAEASPSPWYRRIFSELRGLRREESAFNKAQLRTLNHIDGKEDAKQGGIMGVLGMIGGMLMAALAPLLALLTRIPVLGPLLGKLGNFMPKMLGGGGGARPLPTTVPQSGQTPAGGMSDSAKKPSMWQRAKTKVSGWMGNATAPDGTPTGPLSGAATAAGEAAKKPSLLGRAASGAKGLLKRVPLLGSALAAIGAGASVYESETDEKLTRAQKDKKTGAAIGGGVGSIGGMMAGASAGAALGALGGPIGIAIGTAIGGMAGAYFGEDAGKIIGETVGGWVSEIRAADIPGKVVGAWAATTSFISSTWTDTTAALGKAWDSGVGVFADIWSGVARTFDGVFTGLSEVLKNFGIDLPAVVAKASEAMTASKDAASNLASQATNAVKSKAAEFGEAVKNSAVGKGAAWVLGQTSKLFESGNGGAGTVSTGKGDNGGVSYGTYQLSSKKGKVQDFLKGSPYADQFKGLEVGTDAFGAKWKEVAKNDPKFETAQHDYIKRTNFDPAVAGLKKDGIDLSGRGAAVQDALWSTAVQFGGENKLFQGALKGKDVAKLSDAEIVTAVQDYKLKNNDTLFASSSADVRASTAKRAQSEKAMLLARIQEDEAPKTAAATPNPKDVATAAATATSTNVPAPTATAAAKPVPVAVAAPAVNAVPPAVANIQTYASVPDRIPEATPKPDTQSASSTPISLDRPTPPSVVVVGGKQLAGRDLSNRQMAHVATGGLSGSVG